MRLDGLPFQTQHKRREAEWVGALVLFGVAVADAPAPASYVVTFDEQLAHPTDPGHWMRTGRTIRVTYAPGGQVVQAIDVQAARYAEALDAARRATESAKAARVACLPAGKGEGPPGNAPMTRSMRDALGVLRRGVNQ